MLRIRLLSIGIGIALWGSGMSLRAQNAAQPIAQSVSQPQNLDGDLVLEIHPRPTPTPFPIDAHTGTAAALEFLAPEKMTPGDRELVVAHQAEIARRAGAQGIDLASGAPWGYEQAVCPVLPSQLILDYSRDNGGGDVTLFSVAIPRASGTGGHVRVIPVRRRSYSLWTPAPSNALTLNDFNRIVAEGGQGGTHAMTPDWLTLSLCYTALAGGHVRAALAPASVSEQVFPLFAPATLTVSGKGGAQIHLADVTHYPEPGVKAMDWVLTFAQDGRLLRVRHTVAGEVIALPLPATPDEKALPVPGQVIDASGQPTGDAAKAPNGPTP